MKVNISAMTVIEMTAGMKYTLRRNVAMRGRMRWVSQAATMRPPPTWRMIDTTAYRTLFHSAVPMMGSEKSRAMLSKPTGVIPPAPARNEKKLKYRFAASG